MTIKTIDTDNFTGTEHYYDVMGVNLTDGAYSVYLKGYNWFITDFLIVAKMKQKLKKEEGEY